MKPGMSGKEFLASAVAGYEIGPRVGLCMGRAPSMIAAALAIFKAGGAYVPLDPTYPRERLQAMVDDAGVKLVAAALNTIDSNVRAQEVKVADAKKVTALKYPPHADEQ